MTYPLKEKIVINLGGSILYPQKLNINFLKKFKALIEKRLTKDKSRKFFIVVGGGNLAREFQQGAQKLVSISKEEKDWLGIYATRLNAIFLKTIFNNRFVYEDVIKNEQELNEAIKKIKKYKVFIISGWSPGFSTDFITVKVADNLNCEEYILAGKPAFIYDKNPDKYKNAKPFEKLFWNEYKKIIPNKWQPGINVPIDPIAAKYSKKKKLKAIIVEARNIKNFENLLNGKEFKGTIVS
jgi:uridylate kinase